MTAVVPSLILLAAVVDDLRSRKVHNWLVLGCAAIGIAFNVLTSGLPGLMSGFMGFGMAFALTLPLVLTGILGAGDMKLFCAFGLATGWQVVFVVFMGSLFWGALLGVVRAVISGQGPKLFKNLVQIIKRKETSNLELQKIPYTVALVFGWMSHLVYEGIL